MFKVGDFITGLPKAEWEYGVTNHRAIMRVARVHENSIEVTLISHSNPYENEHIVGLNFRVESRFFKLVDDPTLINKTLIEHKTPIERKIAFMYKRFEER